MGEPVVKTMSFTVDAKTMNNDGLHFMVHGVLDGRVKVDMNENDLEPMNDAARAELLRLSIRQAASQCVDKNHATIKAKLGGVGIDIKPKIAAVL